jgi:hypothetical protein
MYSLLMWLNHLLQFNNCDSHQTWKVNHVSYLFLRLVGQTNLPKLVTADVRHTYTYVYIFVCMYRYMVQNVSLLHKIGHVLVVSINGIISTNTTRHFQ